MRSHTASRLSALTRRCRCIGRQTQSRLTAGLCSLRKGTQESSTKEPKGQLSSSHSSTHSQTVQTPAAECSSSRSDRFALIPQPVKPRHLCLAQVLPEL